MLCGYLKAFKKALAVAAVHSSQMTHLLDIDGECRNLAL
jgi:hypothetical protein